MCISYCIIVHGCFKKWPKSINLDEEFFGRSSEMIHKNYHLTQNVLDKHYGGLWFIFYNDFLSIFTFSLIGLLGRFVLVGTGATISEKNKEVSTWQWFSNNFLNFRKIAKTVFFVNTGSVWMLIQKAVGVVSIWLMVRRKPWTWPFSNATWLNFHPTS